MSLFDGIHFLIYLVLLTLCFKAMGEYLSKVLDPTPPAHQTRTLEKGMYKLLYIPLQKEQTWQEYFGSLLLFSAISGIITCGLLCFQSHFPLNPQGMKDLSFPLAFNTAVSFLTNTDWQAYAGEKTLSYFSQMMALTVQNFFSPAVGLCVAAVLCRSIVRENAITLGNFWIDLTRVLFYLLLPLSMVLAFILMQQGTPQNFSPYLDIATWQSGREQLLVQGPIASQEAIKVLGTNGGGFTWANSAHPYENPTIWTNFLQVISFFLISLGQLYYFGRKTGSLKIIWTLYAVILCFFTAGTIASTLFEKEKFPELVQLGIDPSMGNLEGKEMRFGVFTSCLYSTATTLTSCGSVNAVQCSFTPYAGLMFLANIQLSKLFFGGVGMGLCNIVLFSLLICFFKSLLRRRKPIYLGKCVGTFEVSMAMLAFGLFFFTIVCGSSLSKNGAGLGEVVYAYSSAAANNGSAFTSLRADTPWYNYTLACAMLIGRFGTLLTSLAIAGTLAKKKRHPERETIIKVG